MHRQTNGPAVIGNRAPDRLPNPPRGICGELEAAPELKPVDRLHQTDVAFLDQIEERESASEVALRNRHDETQVPLDELALRLDDGLFLFAHACELLSEYAT